MKSNDKSHLQKRKAELSAILNEQMKLKKDKRDERLISQTKGALDRVTAWLKGKEYVQEVPLVPLKKAEPQRIAIPQDDAAASELPKMQMEEFLEAAKSKGGIMTIDSIEMLNEMWPKIKTSGIQIAGPDFVQEEAMRKIKAEVHKKYFSSPKPVNLEYWGVTNEGEKMHNYVYCPHTRRVPAINWILEGLQLTYGDFKEFEIRFINA